MAQELTHQLDVPLPSLSLPLWRVLKSVIRSGHLRIRDYKGEVREFGDNTGETVAVHFRTSRIQRALLWDPQLAIAEGYMDRDIEMESGTIYDLLSLLVRNLEERPLPYWMQLTDRFRSLTRIPRQMNNLRRSRRNVSHHYDLPGALYDLFLDKDKQYSCAYFKKGTETLDEAQLAKKRHIAAKLCLSPGQQVLDIGSGWGGLSLSRARGWRQGGRHHFERGARTLR